jgi:hypothetical protein
MVKESIQPSRDSLIAFLDFVGEKGLMKKATAASYKKACNIVLRILDEAEATDLSKVDLESVFFRHRNKAAGKIAPKTLKTYEIRTRAAVDSFLQYVTDPSLWKPSVQQRTSRAAKAAPSAKKPKGRERGEASLQPSVHIDLQIHISPEATTTQIDQIFDSISRHLPLK